MESVINILVFIGDKFLYEILAILILLFFLTLRKIFSKYIVTFLRKLTKKTPTDLDDNLLLAFEKPISFAIILFGIYLAGQCLSLTPPYDIFLSKIIRSSIIIAITWGLYNLTDAKSDFTEEIKLRFNIDDIIIQFFSKLIRFVLVALAILMIAQEFGYDVNGFIAGLGLGGLAVALAAKDAIANIFAGIVIILEKPFLIDDWIKISDVEGTVEEITYRSTKIRDFDNSIIIVPNSNLTNEAIINYSRRGERRITYYLSIVHTTPGDKLEKCLDKIKEMLRTHPGVHQETIFVYFEKFEEGNLDIFIYFFSNTTVWDEYLEVRHDTNLKILKILNEESVKLAYPSKSIYMEDTEHITSTKDISI